VDRFFGLFEKIFFIQKKFSTCQQFILCLFLLMIGLGVLTIL